jgi:hypothetical protein
MSQRLPDYDDLRARQARAQEPATTLSEWEIAGRRALHEVDQQIASGNWSMHTVKHILERATA